MNCDGSGEQQRGAGLPERQPHRISARRRRGKCLFRKCVKSWKCRNALSLMDRHRRLIAILTLQRTNSNIFWVNNASKCTMTETRNRIGGERKGAKNKRREKDRRKNYTVECIHARIHMHTHKISCIY
uniref:Uncharacterized protein n=2 Tax=Anguilla anguilla TaxID=7936 RepID=A0A0E9XGH2_ANGAN